MIFSFIFKEIKITLKIIIFCIRGLSPCLKVYTSVLINRSVISSLQFSFFQFVKLLFINPTANNFESSTVMY